MAWTKSTTTKHAGSCKMSFGRKDPSCPRCQELLAGAAPVEQAWRKKYEAPRVRHVCTSSCGPICTYGEW